MFLAHSLSSQLPAVLRAWGTAPALCPPHLPLPWQDTGKSHFAPHTAADMRRTVLPEGCAARAFSGDVGMPCWCTATSWTLPRSPCYQPHHTQAPSHTLFTTSNETSMWAARSHMLSQGTGAVAGVTAVTREREEAVNQLQPPLTPCHKSCRGGGELAAAASPVSPQEGAVPAWSPRSLRAPLGATQSQVWGRGVTALAGS